VKIVWRILRYLRPYRWSLIVAYLSLFIALAAQLSVPKLIQFVIDDGIVPNDSSVIWAGALLIIGVTFLQVRTCSNRSPNALQLMFAPNSTNTCSRCHSASSIHRNPGS
jgi:ABC-type multidrug transport system fused ATPase/permease subunit